MYLIDLLTICKENELRFATTQSLALWPHLPYLVKVTLDAVTNTAPSQMYNGPIEQKFISCSCQAQVCTSVYQALLPAGMQGPSVLRIPSFSPVNGKSGSREGTPIS